MLTPLTTIEPQKKRSPDQLQLSTVTVAVVGICGAAHLQRCLQALAAQVNAPPFDILVVFDPNLTDVPALRNDYPHVRFVSNEGQRSPLELAARAIQLATGDLVLLTEDHCVPRADWVRRLYDAQAEGRAVTGGRVETAPDASAVDWAFYWVDFFRYSDPVPSGPSPTLTVCNVAYRRTYLDSIRPLWTSIFHETAINDALRQRFGVLWLSADAEVSMRRNVRFADAVYERYAFGRLFGCTRLEFASAARRLYYALFAPALPALLLGRMAGKALSSRRNAGPFIRALPALTTMVLAWSWGEWLGYLTRRRPKSLVVAPEIRERMRT